MPRNPSEDIAWAMNELWPALSLPDRAKQVEMRCGVPAPTVMNIARGAGYSTAGTVLRRIYAALDIDYEEKLDLSSLQEDMSYLRGNKEIAEFCYDFLGWPAVNMETHNSWHRRYWLEYIRPNLIKMGLIMVVRAKSNKSKYYHSTKMRAARGLRALYYRLPDGTVMPRSVPSNPLPLTQSEAWGWREMPSTQKREGRTMPPCHGCDHNGMQYVKVDGRSVLTAYCGKCTRMVIDRYKRKPKP